MPIPKPNENEPKEDFIKRCMADPVMGEEYEDNEQRLAVCNVSWEEKEEKHMTKFFDIPCSDEEAKAWEALQKELEKEDLGFKRVFISKQAETDEAEWSDVSVINDCSVDADGEVVLPSGADLTRFRKNPIVALNHNYNELPVGKAAWVKGIPKANPNQIKMKAIYPKRPKDYQGEWKPQAVFELIKAGVLNGKSIGFIALEANNPTQKDIDLQPELENADRVITKWLMLECSVVTLPCNENCVVEHVTKHLQTLGIEFKKVEDKEIVIPKEKKVEIPKPKYIRSWDNIFTSVEDIVSEDSLLDFLRGRP